MGVERRRVDPWLDRLKAKARRGPQRSPRPAGRASNASFCSTEQMADGEEEFVDAEASQLWDKLIGAYGRGLDAAVRDFAPKR